jgi:transposase-like protein
MADSAGVSKSAVSREAAEAGARQLEQLLGRRWEEEEILVIYLDGRQFGSQHVISAVGVDREGRKYVLGIQLGATENAAAADPFARAGPRHLPALLLVIDGAKDLWTLAGILGRTNRAAASQQEKVA